MTAVTARITGPVKELTADGHATGSAQVCAGISALLYALLGWLTNAGDAEIDEAEMEPGHAHIVSLGGGDATEAAWDMAVIGLLQIEQQYPDYITVRIG